VAFIAENVLDAELSLCTALCKWDPWSEPSADLMEALTKLASTKDHCSVSLTRLATARQLVLEAMSEEAAGADRMCARSRFRRPELVFRAGVSVGPRKCDASRAALVSQDLEVAAFASSSVVEKALSKDCSQGAAPHECLTAFRECPAAVRNWRVLWVSMPKSSRYQLVLQMMNKYPDEYVILGRKVCRQAFMIFTGLGAGKLTELRGLASRGQALNARPTGRLGNAPESQKYLDVRQWLEVYAEQHGEMSPMTGVTVLPSGRKSCYYAAYLHDRSGEDLFHLDGKAADYTTFLRAWRQECWFILVAKSESLFTRCGVCEFLKEMLDSTPRSQDGLLRAVRARLGFHYSFQAAQRLAQSRLEETCLRSGGKQWRRPHSCRVAFPNVCFSSWAFAGS